MHVTLSNGVTWRGISVLSGTEVHQDGQGWLPWGGVTKLSVLTTIVTHLCCQGRLQTLVLRGGLLVPGASHQPGDTVSSSPLTPPLPRLLKEQEDTVRKDTIQVGPPVKKKSCCG